MFIQHCELPFSVPLLQVQTANMLFRDPCSIPFSIPLPTIFNQIGILTRKSQKNRLRRFFSTPFFRYPWIQEYFFSIPFFGTPGSRISNTQYFSRYPWFRYPSLQIISLGTPGSVPLYSVPLFRYPWIQFHFFRTAPQ